MAERHRDLFHRFVYVGITRAATYLGLTCATTLPTILEPLRPHFAKDGWTGLASEPVTVGPAY